jgi:histidinol-phosphate/aromatic aminotransferase/cobyric acid decarboxylase-like protein
MQIYEKYHKEYLKACEAFREERKLFYDELQEVPYLHVIPSQANYFLCEVIGGNLSARELAVQLLSDYDILIKDCSSKAAFNNRNYIRLAIRDRKDNHTLVEALKRYI